MPLLFGTSLVLSVRANLGLPSALCFGSCPHPTSQATQCSDKCQFNPSDTFLFHGLPACLSFPSALTLANTSPSSAHFLQHIPAHWVTWCSRHPTTWAHLVPLLFWYMTPWCYWQANTSLPFALSFQHVASHLGHLVLYRWKMMEPAPRETTLR